MDLSKRNTERELMDDPKVRTATLLNVLKDINRANRMLGGNRITISAMARLMEENPKESYTIVDMGCGDGTMLRAVALFCRKKGYAVKLIGLDLSEKAIQIAKDASQGFSGIQFLQKDILELKMGDLECDILLCTLTVHHFHNEQIPIFLKQFVKLARIGVVINDLQRSSLAYYLFKGFSAIFIRTKIARHDGLISIKSGFTKRELMGFSHALPQMEHTIHWKWAFRYVWVIGTDRLTSAYE